MKNQECTIVFTCSAETKQRGHKPKHGKFERKIENQMQEFFVQYMKYLVGQIPEASKYSWERKGNNMRLVEAKS